MAKTVADVMKMVKDNEVKFVDFRFTDTRGKEQHVSVPTKAVRHNDPSPLLCPEDRGSLCDFTGIFRIKLMHHNTPLLHYYSAQ